MEMQDIGGGHDNNKETSSKAMKHLIKLFPNKVTLEAPQVCCWNSSKMINLDWPLWHSILIYPGQMLQGEMELLRWNQMLNRDIEVLKGNANISKIRSVSISAKSVKPTPYLTMYELSIIIIIINGFE